MLSRIFFLPESDRVILREIVKRKNTCGLWFNFFFLLVCKIVMSLNSNYLFYLKFVDFKSNVNDRYFYGSKIFYHSCEVGAIVTLVKK